MANLGNTGKRYKFRVIVGAFVSERGGVTFVFSCGHRDDPYEPRYETDYRWTQEKANEKVGKRVACFRCGAEKRTN